MRAVIQRVLRASVEVDGQVVGQCGQGYLLLVAAGKQDTPATAKKMASKVHTLRIFEDGEGKMNLALPDIGGEVLAVSNFTVYGDASQQRRPSFMAAAPFEEGRVLFDLFVQELRALGPKVETGIFGADMKVELVNDGPVTLVLEVD